MKNGQGPHVGSWLRPEVIIIEHTLLDLHTFMEIATHGKQNMVFECLILCHKSKPRRYQCDANRKQSSMYITMKTSTFSIPRSHCVSLTTSIDMSKCRKSQQRRLQLASTSIFVTVSYLAKDINALKHKRSHRRGFNNSRFLLPVHRTYKLSSLVLEREYLLLPLPFFRSLLMLQNTNSSHLSSSL